MSDSMTSRVPLLVLLGVPLLVVAGVKDGLIGVLAVLLLLVVLALLGVGVPGRRS